MNAQHTPGPWEWRDTTLYGTGSEFINAIVNDDGCTVYRDSPVDAFQAEIEANKRLIAAAPELLSALELAEVFVAKFEDDQDYTEGQTETLHAVRAAISKAKGGAA